MSLRILLLIGTITIGGHQLFGQDSPLFCIVTCSEDVLLDGNNVQPGQLVYSQSTELSIPRNGYVGVITNEGRAFTYKESISVKSVVQDVRHKNMTRMVTNSNIEIVGAPRTRDAVIEGDSILVALKGNFGVGPPYIINIFSIFDQDILTDSINENWKLMNVRGLLAEYEAVLVKAKSENENRSSYEHVIKRIRKDQLGQLNFDLSRIPENHPNKYVMKIAVYELNHLYYDHLFHLYKHEISPKASNEGFFKNYLVLLREKYHFDQFNFKK